MGRLLKPFLVDHGYGHADVLIETGTAGGMGTYRVADLYPLVHTIEIDPVRHREAVKRLRVFPHVQCHLGDSRELLPKLIDPTKRTVFWIDAHFDGRETGRAPEPGIILDELEIVLSVAWRAPFAALIDDAEKFGKRFWTMDVAQHHKQEYWEQAENVQRVISEHGYAYQIIRTSKGEVWTIAKDWQTDAVPRAI